MNDIEPATTGSSKKKKKRKKKKTGGPSAEATGTPPISLMIHEMYRMYICTCTLLFTVHVLYLVLCTCMLYSCEI